MTAPLHSSIFRCSYTGRSIFKNQALTGFYVTLKKMQCSCISRDSHRQHPKGTFKLQVLPYDQIQYLKPPHSSEKNIRGWFTSLHLRIITHDNMMHQGKHFLVVLGLQCKMTFMGPGSHSNSATNINRVLIHGKTMGIHH